MSKKGLPKHWYNSKYKAIKEVTQKYEIDLDIVDDNYWQFRATYFGQLIFDYYPKNRKICLFPKGRQTWDILDSDYIQHIHRICNSLIILGSIDLDFKL